MRLRGADPPSHRDVRHVAAAVVVLVAVVLVVFEVPPARTRGGTHRCARRVSSAVDVMTGEDRSPTAGAQAARTCVVLAPVRASTGSTWLAVADEVPVEIALEPVRRKGSRAPPVSFV